MASRILGCSVRKKILPETQFERDLGLTGDDGDDLLEATEKRFQVRLGNEEQGSVRLSISDRMNTSLIPKVGVHLHAKSSPCFPVVPLLFGNSRWVNCLKQSKE